MPAGLSPIGPVAVLLSAPLDYSCVELLVALLARMILRAGLTSPQVFLLPVGLSPLPAVVALLAVLLP